MNINNDVRIISWHRDNATNNRPSVPKLYCANGRIEKSGIDINGKTTSSNGDIIFQYCRAGSPKECVAIKQNNGDVILRDDCHVQGDVEIQRGHATIEKTTIKGNLVNRNGTSTFHDSHAEKLSSFNGNIALTRSEADSIISYNGDIFLEDHSVVHHEVQLSNGKIFMESSTINGKLELNSNKMEIGKNSSVHHLKINCVNEISLGTLSSIIATGNVKITINGIQRYPVLQPGGDSEKPTQVLILREGAELHHVEFNGKNLIINLEGNASYTGGEMKGLTINRIK